MYKDFIKMVYWFLFLAKAQSRKTFIFNFNINFLIIILLPSRINNIQDFPTVFFFKQRKSIHAFVA